VCVYIYIYINNYEVWKNVGKMRSGNYVQPC